MNWNSKKQYQQLNKTAKSNKVVSPRLKSFYLINGCGTLFYTYADNAFGHPYSDPSTDQ